MLFRSRVVENGRLVIEVRDEEGKLEFPVPQRLLPAIASRTGEQVQLGLRPETIAKRGTHQKSVELYSFERAIDVVEPTGPDTMLVFTLGGIEAIARVHPDEAAPPGTSFPFEVNMDKAKIFDGKTGKRL